jgi:hypothetical protein
MIEVLSMNHTFDKRGSYTRSDELPSRTRRTLRGIEILDISVEIENKSTVVDEKSKSVLKYKTPHFK